MKKSVLLIADLHGKLSDEQIQKEIDRHPPDAVFFLGDNRPRDIKCVLDHVPKEIPKLGVVGNHDRENWLTRCGVEDLHCRTTSLWGVTLGGFRGSIRYPNARTKILYTNRESEEEIKKLPPCQILLTHDRPRFRHPWSIGVDNETCHVHSGLTGIGEYIRKYQPRYVFFGHLHRRYVWYYWVQTRMQCCYGVQSYMIDLQG